MTMLPALLVLLPALLGLAALRVRGAHASLGLLLFGAALHAAGTASLWVWRPAPWAGELLALDSLGLLFLSITSVVFLAACLYAVPYLLHGTYASQGAPHRFVPCLLWFLAAMTLVCVTQHLALLWAAVEATTLASAPLIYFYRRPGALEAAWKYLLLCSVGIALALLGVFFLGVAASAAPGARLDLTVSGLSALAPSMSRPWLTAAFVLALVGYGTKMGLVPLHTWLPDAHSQAPSPVSALLSGALLNGAFLAILRFLHVCSASGDAGFARTLLLVFGFGSMAVAAGFMLLQRDYKRLLAYSSIENMGILCVGAGLGAGATYGALLHAVNHSLCKAGFFFVAGNVLREYSTTDAGEVRGVLRRLPVTGGLMLVFLFALGGTPPSGTFWSKFLIFRAGLEGSNPWPGVLFAALATVAFLGMAATVLPMVYGGEAAGASTAGASIAGAEPRASAPHGGAGPARGPARRREATLAVAAPMALAAAVVAFGLVVPPSLGLVLRDAVRALWG